LHPSRKAVRHLLHRRRVRPCLHRLRGPSCLCLLPLHCRPFRLAWLRGSRCSCRPVRDSKRLRPCRPASRRLHGRLWRLFRPCRPYRRCRRPSRVCPVLHLCRRHPDHRHHRARLRPFHRLRDSTTAECRSCRRRPRGPRRPVLRHLPLLRRRLHHLHHDRRSKSARRCCFRPASSHLLHPAHRCLHFRRFRLRHGHCHHRPLRRPSLLRVHRPPPVHHAQRCRSRS
jgi:hypothetical protein